MKPASLLLVTRLSITAAAFASAALVIDYRNAGDPTFCGTESACFKVRTSDIGRDIAEKINDIIPGASLPAVALAIFAGLLALSFFVQSRLWVRAFAAVSTVGAAFAAFFIYHQAKLGQLCAYCMVVDVAMIVAAAAAIRLAMVLPSDALAERELGPSMATHVTLVWGVAGSLITVMPFLWAEFPKVDPLPEPLRVHEEPGKLTVISFTDFQCPFCRRLHPTLVELKNRGDVKFVRLMVPLDGHPGAVPAALGYLCVPEAKREEMAHALYTAPDAELTYERVALLAEKVSALPLDDLKTCIGNPETRAKVDAEKKLFDDLGLSGLPTTFVGPRKIRGASAERVIAASKAMDIGLALPPWLMFVAAGVVLGAAAALSHRQLGKERSGDTPPAGGDGDDGEEAGEGETEAPVKPRAAPTQAEKKLPKNRRKRAGPARGDAPKAPPPDDEGSGSGEPA